MLKELRWHNSQ